MFRIDLCSWSLLHLLNLMLLRRWALDHRPFGWIGISTAFVIRSAVLGSATFRVYASVLLRGRTVYAADLGDAVVELALLFLITECVGIKLVVLLLVILPRCRRDIIGVADCFDTVPLL